MTNRFFGFYKVLMAALLLVGLAGCGSDATNQPASGEDGERERETDEENVGISRSALVQGGYNI